MIEKEVESKHFLECVQGFHIHSCVVWSDQRESEICESRRKYSIIFGLIFYYDVKTNLTTLEWYVRMRWIGKSDVKLRVNNQGFLSEVGEELRNWLQFKESM